ncbi:MAG: outer membrane lipoprotein-sorting protein [Thermodesulfobacteriota bacterium]
MRKNGLLGGVICLLLLLPQPLWASEAQEIITKVVDNLDGKTAVLEFRMEVKTRRSKRTMTMESYSQGHDRSFVKILYPRKDAGITFLKVDKAMWQYVPRIEKVIKIPASMMLQSWMGSDFTNDDLVKESSLADDYESRLISEDERSHLLELIPRPEAPVVWGKIIMAVSRAHYLPEKVSYYDEEGGLVRELYYREVRKFGSHFYPSSWQMIPRTPDKAGHETNITVIKATFDEPVDPAYFSKRALKRFSR